MSQSPLLITYCLNLITPSRRTAIYKVFVLFLTFLCYTSYHLSRKPISIVKPILHNDSCDGNTTHQTTTERPTTTTSLFTTLPPRTTIVPGSTTANNTFVVSLPTTVDTINTIQGDKENGCGYPPFDKSNGKALLGSLDYAFLFAYAVGMFISGHIAERVNIRYFLTIGMLGSGVFTALFGLGRFWNLHILSYFIIMQVFAGLFQASGWPSVVTCVSNWFGKGRRGLIMGIWNSHTSVGNILGSVIAGYYVETNWGMSFIVPAAIIASLGVVVFLVLVPDPSDIGCEIPNQNDNSIAYTVIANDSDSETVISSDMTSEDEPLMRSSTNSELLDAEIQLSRETAISQEMSTEVVTPHQSQHHPKAISFVAALQIPGVLEFSACLFFAKLVSYTFLYWLPEYLHHSTSYGPERAADLSTVFDFGGIFGGIMAGVISDALGSRASVCSIMLLCAAPMMFFYQAFGNTSLTINIVMLLVVGAFVNGPYALITTAVSADLGTHESLHGNAKALSTVTAIIDGTGSIGAALGPLFTGLIASHSDGSWGNVFYMLIAADLAAFLVSVYVWCHNTKKHRKSLTKCYVSEQNFSLWGFCMRGSICLLACVIVVITVIFLDHLVTRYLNPTIPSFTH